MLASQPMIGLVRRRFLEVVVADAERIVGGIVVTIQNLALQGAGIEAERVHVLGAGDERATEVEGRALDQLRILAAVVGNGVQGGVGYRDHGKILPRNGAPGDPLGGRQHRLPAHLLVARLAVLVVAEVAELVAPVEGLVGRADLRPDGKRVGAAVKVQVGELVGAVLDLDFQLEEVGVGRKRIGLGERERHPVGRQQRAREAPGEIVDFLEAEHGIDRLGAKAAEGDAEEMMLLRAQHQLHVGAVHVVMLLEPHRGQVTAGGGEHQGEQVGLLGDEPAPRRRVLPRRRHGAGHRGKDVGAVDGASGRLPALRGWRRRAAEAQGIVGRGKQKRLDQQAADNDDHREADGD